MYRRCGAGAMLFSSLLTKGGFAAAAAEIEEYPPTGAVLALGWDAYSNQKTNAFCVLTDETKINPVRMFFKITQKYMTKTP